MCDLDRFSQIQSQIWKVKFGKSPLICQIRQTFPMPNICAMLYYEVLIIHRYV